MEKQLRRSQYPNQIDRALSDAAGFCSASNVNFHPPVELFYPVVVYDPLHSINVAVNRVAGSDYNGDDATILVTLVPQSARQHSPVAKTRKITIRLEKNIKVWLCLPRPR